MAGLISTLEISRNTLLNQQLMIQTASHNVANAANPYYAKQRVQTVTNPPSRIAAGWIGNGAQASQITQVRDQYIESQLLGSVSQESDQRTRSTLLGVITSRLTDNGTSGLSQDLGAFWDSWQALSQNTQGLVEKDAVLASAQNLVDSIHGAQGALVESRQSIDAQIGDASSGMIAKINDLLAQIGDHNQRIVGYEGTGQSANDLRDLRYQALSELSQYIGISYTEQSNGAVTVTMTDGATPINLVTNQNYGTLQYNSATHLVSYVDATGAAIAPASNSLSGGILAGDLYTFARTVAYESQLDTFTASLATHVNAAYGAAVFDNTTAATVTLNPTFNNPATLDGNNALAVAALQDNQSYPELLNQTFGQYLSHIQSQIAQDQLSATSRADFQKALVVDLQTQQQAVSGVSLEEEAIDLLKFQQIYSAAAKIVSRTDEMLRAVIDMV